MIRDFRIQQKQKVNLRNPFNKKKKPDMKSRYDKY